MSNIDAYTTVLDIVRTTLSPRGKRFMPPLSLTGNPPSPSPSPSFGFFTFFICYSSNFPLPHTISLPLPFSIFSPSLSFFPFADLVFGGVVEALTGFRGGGSWCLARGFVFCEGYFFCSSSAMHSHYEVDRRAHV